MVDWKFTIGSHILCIWDVNGDSSNKVKTLKLFLLTFAANVLNLLIDAFQSNRNWNDTFLIVSWFQVSACVCVCFLFYCHTDFSFVSFFFE